MICQLYDSGLRILTQPAFPLFISRGSLFRFTVLCERVLSDEILERLTDLSLQRRVQEMWVVHQFLSVRIVPYCVPTLVKHLACSLQSTDLALVNGWISP
jgi:hypothetical protein